MVPAVEFLFLDCQYGNYEDKIFDITCREDGFAIEYEAKTLQMNMRIWRTTETWIFAEFKGESVRDIVAEFALDKSPAQDVEIPAIFSEELIYFARNECSGPNCLEEWIDSSVEPSCQSLI